MSEVIAWAGFAGSWLLVAGPVYQAALELREEDLEREEIEAVSNQVEPTDSYSPWWWLIPPVAYVLLHRRRQAWRVAMMNALTRSQVEQMVSYFSKAVGWMYIAAGAALIALKETWEVREVYEWPIAAYVAVVVVMPILCAVNTIVRIQRSTQLLAVHPAD